MTQIVIIMYTFRNHYDTNGHNNIHGYVYIWNHYDLDSHKATGVRLVEGG